MGRWICGGERGKEADVEVNGSRGAGMDQMVVVVTGLSWWKFCFE